MGNDFDKQHLATIGSINTDLGDEPHEVELKQILAREDILIGARNYAPILSFAKRSFCPPAGRAGARSEKMGKAEKAKNVIIFLPKCINCNESTEK